MSGLRVVWTTSGKTSLFPKSTSMFQPVVPPRIDDPTLRFCKDNNHTWDLYLNQALAAIRFSINETTKFSPFFLLFQRDPVFPIDNLLKPRRRYYGDDIIEKGLEQTHKAFVMVHKRQKEAKRKQAKYANKNRKDMVFNIGDPVYFKNHIKGKLGQHWKPYYRIIEKKTPVTFTLKDQLTGDTVPAHATHIQHANIDEWEIPKDQANKRFRRANFVVPPSESVKKKASHQKMSQKPNDITLCKNINMKGQILRMK